MKSMPIPLVAFLLLLAAPGLARTIPVGAGGEASSLALENAIVEASSGDTILVHPGVYENALIYVAGKGLVIRSVAGPEKTVLDGGKARLVVWLLRTDAATVIEGFTIRNGFDAQHGGGIRIGGMGHHTVRNNIIEGCQAPFGGGIYLAPRSMAVIEGNLFKGNIATHTGGGLYTQHAQPTIRNNTFVGNNAEKPGSAIGLFAASPTIENNLFVENRGEAAVYLMNAKCAPVLGCNGYFMNKGTDVGGGEGAVVPEEPERRSADPLFADSNTYRLSSGSPYAAAGSCGKIGW
ncbi:MAG: right-handed parallel beta-helix repeat-containing protein [Candidatus Eisenbacteria bacterium]